MSVIEKSIEINVPVKTAYNQWTQFEDFPRFMEGVEQVRQIDDKHLHWKASIGGTQNEWDAVIAEQIPDQRISWMSQGGSKNGGVIIFSKVSENRSKLSLRLEYEAEGAVEKTGDAVGVVSRRVEGDLQRFKDFIESRGQETGAWRGKVA